MFLDIVSKEIVSKFKKVSRSINSFKPLLSKILKKLGENSKIKTCSYYFEKWETWAAQFPEINVLSAERFYIVHYIMHLLQIGNTFPVTRMSYFGLNYFHSIVGYQNLCPSSLPYNVLEGIKRLLAYSAIFEARKLVFTNNYEQF